MIAAWVTLACLPIVALLLREWWPLAWAKEDRDIKSSGRGAER